MPIKPRNVIDFDDPRVSKIGHPAPPWLVNYADLMTEMVCFFVILYALSAALSKDIQKTKKEVEEIVKEEQMPVETKVTKEGLEISLQEKEGIPFFGSGSAELSEPMIKYLNTIAPLMLKSGNEIIVEGHTDNVPIRTAQYQSNWELSTARATSVVRHLINNQKFPPQMLAAIGYGEYKQYAPNDSDKNRALNRRIVFLVKTTKAKKETVSQKEGGE